MYKLIHQSITDQHVKNIVVFYSARIYYQNSEALNENVWTWKHKKCNHSHKTRSINRKPIEKRILWHLRFEFYITRGINFDPVKSIWRRPYHVLNMQAEWTLIHLRGVPYFRVFLWSRVEDEVWSTFDFRCNHKYKSGAMFIFRTIWKWIKLHF